MTARELIKALLDHPLDSVVYVGKGMGPVTELAPVDRQARPVIILKP